MQIEAFLEKHGIDPADPLEVSEAVGRPAVGSTPLIPLPYYTLHSIQHIV